MRDIVLALLMVGIVPAAFLRPCFGALAWVCVSIMSPHRMTYGFMYDAPVAMALAGAMMLGLVFTRDHRRLVFAPPVVLMIMFTLWMVVTYPFSLVPTDENTAQLSKVLKVMLLNLVVLIPLVTRRHVNLLVGTLAGSIAFFGVKGGLFALATGGNYQVRGGGGFIEPNNELALALVMSIPLVAYFIPRATRWYQRWALIAVIFFTAVAAISSQSRGALLAMAAMAGAFLIRSPTRLKLLLPMLATGAFILAFMPDAWWARMETIQTYKTDASALGRINAWILAWRIATEHFFGGGFVLEHPSLFDRYAPNPEFIAVAHSLYFQTLGQHGFVGLLLYLSIWFATFRTCIWIYRNTDSESDRQLVRMVEVSLVAFAVGGAFLSLAYFDGPYYLMVAMVVLRYKVLGNRKRAVASNAGSTPSPATPVPR